MTSLIVARAKALEQVGIESARAEVELILCHVLDIDRLGLYMHGSQLLNEDSLRCVEAIIERRLTRYPLQYILEEAWFYGRRFFVSPAVMVPTPETELLCEQALTFTRHRHLEHPRIVDIGAGAGVISVTMACEIPRASIIALDVSTAAIEVARRNAREHGVLERIHFRESDLFSAIEKDEKFDLILSNPPYIAEPDYEGLQPEVKADPRIAMTSGADGLDTIREIIGCGPEYLEPGGRIMFEIGYRQSGAITAITERDKRYRSIDILKDLNDIDRLVILACKG